MRSCSSTDCHVSSLIWGICNTSVIAIFSQVLRTDTTSKNCWTAGLLVHNHTNYIYIKKKIIIIVCFVLSRWTSVYFWLNEGVLGQLEERAGAWLHEHNIYLPQISKDPRYCDAFSFSFFFSADTPSKRDCSHELITKVAFWPFMGKTARLAEVRNRRRHAIKWRAPSKWSTPATNLVRIGSNFITLQTDK